MRFWVFLLAKWVLVLSFYPCDDFVRHGQEAAIFSHQAVFKGVEVAREHCSPFCICQCCHFPVLLFHGRGVTLWVSDFHGESRFPYIYRGGRVYIHSIWHPPKLG